MKVLKIEVGHIVFYFLFLQVKKQQYIQTYRNIFTKLLLTSDIIQLELLFSSFNEYIYFLHASFYIKYLFAY